MLIDFSLDNYIATITVNRPGRMNALNAEHCHAHSAAWIRARNDSEVRVANITGAGEKSFTAGVDFKSFVTAQPSLAEVMLTQNGQLLNRGLEGWKPVASAINGYCLGGGVTLDRPHLTQAQLALASAAQ